MITKLAPLLVLIVLLAPTKPVTKKIILLVDVSGSMEDNGRASQALAAASMIYRQPVDEAQVLPIAWADKVTVYDKGWEMLPSEEAAKRIDTWITSKRSKGATYLAQALTEVLTRPELIDEEISIIIITDGVLHYDSEEALLTTLAEGQAKRKRPASIGVWGINHTTSNSKLMAIAKAGGGGYIVSDD